MIVKTIDANFNEVLETNCVACIGYFDGLHKGHQLLFEQVFKLADNTMKKACICFDQDPHALFYKERKFCYITPNQDRLNKLNALGFDVCYLLRFNETMANLSVTQFNTLLERMNIKHLVCGMDFHYASKGVGNINTLMQSNISIHVLDLLEINNKKISSSGIEQNLIEGNIREANEALGYKYSIQGVVVHGSNVGNNKLGFPTANIEVLEAYIIPKQGVYKGYVGIQGIAYLTMINIGHNPTMNYKNELSIEAHIIDFDAVIYGETVEVTFEHFIREEKTFRTIDDLIYQLQQDVIFVKREGENYES